MLYDAANVQGTFAHILVVMLNFWVYTWTFGVGGADSSFSDINFVPHVVIKTFSSGSCVLSGLSLLLWLWL